MGFWGGFLGGALLLARNYWVLRRRLEAVAIFLAFVVLTIVASYSLTEPSVKGSHWLFGAFAALILWFSGWFLQGHLCRKHEKAGGPLGSGIGAFGFGLLGCVLTVGLILGLFGISAVFTQSLGTRLAIGHDDEIYYSGGATREEAHRLGQFLKADGTFDASTPQGAVLSRSHQLVLVSFFLDDGEWNKPETLRNYEDFAVTLSAEIFNGQPVQILLRDQRNQIQHPYLAESQNALAAVLLSQERTADAEPLLEQALKSFEAVLGPVHPQLVGPLNNLGSVYEQRGRDAAAEEHLERALKLAEGLVGKDHPYLLSILQNYAKVLRKLNRPDEALELERRSEIIRTKSDPKGTPTSGSPVII